VHGQEAAVNLPGEVALKAAHDLGLGLALCGASREVDLGGFVPVHARDHSSVQRRVGLAVAAAVESEARDLSGGGRDGVGAAERGEGSLAVEPCGLSPAASRSAAAVSGPTRSTRRGPAQPPLSGRQGTHEGAWPRPAGSGLGGPAGEGRTSPQTARWWAHRGAGPHSAPAAPPVRAGQGLPQLAGRRDEHRFELVDRLRLGFDGRVAGQLQDSDDLDLVVAVFRGSGCGAGQHGSCGGFGVDGIGLALAVPGGSVGPVDLDDASAGVAQVAGEPSAVGTGAFPPNASTCPRSPAQWCSWR